MPWSQDQMRTARAVAHGWKPKGSAKGFTKGFAEQVIREGVKGKRKGKKHAGMTLGHMARKAME